MTRDEWVSAFSRAAGTAGASVAETRDLLELAAIAAHASERTAAPLACWVAGRSELPLPQLLEAARAISGGQPERD